MPVHRGKDSQGCFYQWGGRKKYYYTPGDAKSRKAAEEKAHKQARAIYARGYRG